MQNICERKVIFGMWDVYPGVECSFTKYNTRQNHVKKRLLLKPAPGPWTWMLKNLDPEKPEEEKRIPPKID